MPRRAAATAEAVSGEVPAAGCQYSATDGPDRCVSAAAMSAQPITVLCWAWTMPDSRSTNAA